MQRRAVALGAFVSALFTGGLSRALSPPPPPPPTLDELVREAKIIVVGEVTAFHFKGVLRNEEFRRTFSTLGEGRALYATIRRIQVLKNKLGVQVGQQMQAIGFPLQHYAMPTPGSKSVLLIRRVYDDRSDRGTVLTFDLATDPIDIDKLPEIEKIIAAQ